MADVNHLKKTMQDAPKSVIKKLDWKVLNLLDDELLNTYKDHVREVYQKNSTYFMKDLKKSVKKIANLPGLESILDEQKIRLDEVVGLKGRADGVELYSKLEHLHRLCHNTQQKQVYSYSNKVLFLENQNHHKLHH